MTPSLPRPARAVRTVRSGQSTGPEARRLGVFSVEDTSVQLTWGQLGPGPVRLRAADTFVDIEADGGPGGVALDGLPAGRAISIALTGEGVPGNRIVVQARTLDALPGEELYRLATVGDLHLGSIAFGYRRTIVEVERPVVPHPMRCGAAAVEDLMDWGAQRMVVKGDITESGQPWEWHAFARLIAGPLARGLPIDVLAGNHDYSQRHTIDPDDALAELGLGLVRAKGVETLDLPGLRLVLVDSVYPGHHHGRLTRRQDDTVAALRDAPGGALIVMHHQLEPHAVTLGWPQGIPRREAMPFLDAVGAAHPDTLVTSGHTHRHRRWRRGPVTISQVGSTKDFPGVWAGYVVHEGGIRQVVRRVTRPDCIAWTDRTRAAALGLWGVAAPGRLSSRCFNLEWSSRRA